MYMISVFFVDMVNAKARQTTMSSTILASPCRNRETIQASSAYSMSHTARRTLAIAVSGPDDVCSSFRCIRSARMTVSSLNLWRKTVSTTAKNILNNSEDGTYPYRSPCSTSNKSEQTPSSGRIQVLIPSWNCWITAIIRGGTPMRVSTCHRRMRPTVSYVSW